LAYFADKKILMKICDLTQFYSPVSGGVKRYIHEKVGYLHEFAPDDEHILIIPGEKDAVVADGKSKTYSLRSPLISKTSRYRALLRLGAVEEILEREMPDVIESGDPYQMAWKAIASGRALDIPVVGFYHSHFPEAYLRSTAKFFGKTVTELVMDVSQRYVCTLYNRFARTLVPAPALGALLESWGVHNVTNIDLGVNTRIFRPEPDDAFYTRAELDVPRDAFLLLYVGRLAHEKNTRTLFDAFALLTKKHPGRFHLLAVGDGSQRDSLKELQAATGAVSWLAYCGESEQLAKFYRAADLFVHPGVQETFGLVTLEAQACGTPVVGIRGSYMDRIIHSDQTYWADENSPESLARAIVESSAQDLKKIGAAASAKVLNLYSWRRVFDRLFAIYRTVADE
jgi:alpha-1,6-mannosyltransferase